MPTPHAEPARPKNVLLVCTDHWPGALLGCAGHPTVRTPTLDNLAANGRHFPNAYTTVPACMPARRSLLTGLTPYTHGTFSNEMRRLPSGVPSLAQAFRDNGYHAVGVGKMEVFPTRSRAGFDETIVDFEGRGFRNGEMDDYELFLADEGHAGQRYTGGMCNNGYMYRPWHLDERLHVTNWTTQQMCRQITRRDPDKPGFWYLSYSHPHPPLNPLRDYLDLYRDLDPPLPVRGDWDQDADRSPRLQDDQKANPPQSDLETQRVRRAFYALCTHIDHQFRVVLGTLREQGLLDDTIILFTADHGDMLGDHGLWSKRNCFEGEANVPMLLAGPGVDRSTTDHRLVSLEDIYPTLLSLAGIDIPDHVEGLSMVGASQRDTVVCVKNTTSASCRMIRDDRYKLVYFPAGNQRLLFDLEQDRRETRDLSSDADHADTLDRLTQAMIQSFQLDEEKQWVDGNRLVGADYTPQPAGGSRHYSLQRGVHFPPVVRQPDYSE